MSAQLPNCPRCDSQSTIKSGVIRNRQRYYCKACEYYFTVQKEGKRIDSYYVIKALQLYLEGLSYREIERIIGVSHVSVMNWVKEYRISRPKMRDSRPTYRVLKHRELLEFLEDKENVIDNSLLITPVGDKFMLIKWEKFRGQS
jgi:transposase-like protein